MALDPAAVPELSDVPEGAVAIGVAGVVRRTRSGVLYRDVAGDDLTEAPTPIGLNAVPYFLWGNRTAGPMRVWIPVAPTPPDPGRAA